jgi:hypothetical protein
MSDSWFPRVSPDGRHVAAGTCAVSIDGVTVEPGRIPQWLTPDTIIYTLPDGVTIRTCQIGGQPRTIGAATANGLSAGAGHWAASRGTAEMIVDGVTHIPGAYQPAVYGPHVAYVLDGDLPTQRLILDGSVIAIGPMTNLQMSSLALTWTQFTDQNTRVTMGTMLASQAPVRLQASYETEFGSCPVETPNGVWVLAYDNSRLLLYPWGSRFGHIVAEGGETYYPHAAWCDDGYVLVAWSNHTGQSGSARMDLSQLRIDLSVVPTLDYGPSVTRPVWYGWYKNLNTAVDGSQGSCYHAERVGLVRLSDGALIVRPADGEGLLWTTPSGETWLGGQAYLDAPGPATVAEARTMLRAKIDQIVAGWNGQPGVLIPQAYDRGGTWKNQETLVGMQVEYLDAVRQHENVVALVPFALDRLGGANSYPALRAAWDEIGKRLHAPELVVTTAAFPTAITIEYPSGGITIRGTGPNKVITIDHLGGLPPGVKSVVRMNDLNMTAEYQERTTGRVLAKTGVKRPVRLEP